MIRTFEQRERFQKEMDKLHAAQMNNSEFRNERKKVMLNILLDTKLKFENIYKQRNRRSIYKILCINYISEYEIKQFRYCAVVKLNAVIGILKALNPSIEEKYYSVIGLTSSGEFFSNYEKLETEAQQLEFIESMIDYIESLNPEAS